MFPWVFPVFPSVWLVHSSCLLNVSILWFCLKLMNCVRFQFRFQYVSKLCTFRYCVRFSCYPFVTSMICWTMQALSSPSINALALYSSISYVSCRASFLLSLTVQSISRNSCSQDLINRYTIHIRPGQNLRFVLKPLTCKAALHLRINLMFNKTSVLINYQLLQTSYRRQLQSYA